MCSKSILLLVSVLAVGCKATTYESISTGVLSTHPTNQTHLETNSTETSETTTLLTPVVRVVDNTTKESSNSSSFVEFFDTNDSQNITSLNDKSIQTPDKGSTNDISNNDNKNNRRYQMKDYNRDPLQRNAQSQNPFLSGAPGVRGGRRQGAGGLDPQIAQILQNNPRIRQLAEQNPEIAQQIFQNPRLLRDPRIQNLIRSQLGNGGGAGLLGLLPGALGGLGGALNPLGIGLGSGPSRQGAGGLGLGAQRSPQSGTDGGLFGAPRAHNRANLNRIRNNEENIGGGFYGNNRNYQNNNKNNNNRVNKGRTSEGNDYEDNTGAKDNANEDSGQEGGEEGQEGGEGGEEGGDEGQEAQDPNQDPANDPDIQQLQNLGGGIGDNFPEGLFPPGLLSKEDLDEIKKQQEKQAKEQAAKEKQQQAGAGGQGGDGTEGQDYDYGNGEEGEGGEGGDGAEGGGEGGDEETTEGGEDGGAEDTSSEPESPTTTTPATPPAYRQPQSQQKYRPEFGGIRQSSANNPGVEYDEILDENTPLLKPPTVNTVKAKGKVTRTQVNAIPPAIPVPAVQYNQQPIQPYINTQPVPGVYQQPFTPQGYPQPQQYGQPIQYYPPYQPQYGPPQQYAPQQQQPYPPQHYVPQQPYAGQQPGQYVQNQPQVYPYSQQTYPPQQHSYGQFPQNPTPIRGQSGYNSANQSKRQSFDPNLINHNMNTVPHDDAEDTNEGYDEQSIARLSAQRLRGQRGQRGRSFQQQPRLFSSVASSAAHNTESSVAYNTTTQPSAHDSNKFNVDNSLNTINVDKHSSITRFGF